MNGVTAFGKGTPGNFYCKDTELYSSQLKSSHLNVTMLPPDLSSNLQNSVTSARHSVIVA